MYINKEKKLVLLLPGAMFPEDVWQTSRWSQERTEWFVPNATTDSFRWIKNLIVLVSLWYFGAAKRVHRDLSFCCLAVPPA